MPENDAKNNIDPTLTKEKLDSVIYTFTPRGISVTVPATKEEVDDKLGDCYIINHIVKQKLLSAGFSFEASIPEFSDDGWGATNITFSYKVTNNDKAFYGRDIVDSISNLTQDEIDLMAMDYIHLKTHFKNVDDPALIEKTQEEIEETTLPVQERNDLHEDNFKKINPKKTDRFIKKIEDKIENAALTYNDEKVYDAIVRPLQTNEKLASTFDKNDMKIIENIVNELAKDGDIRDSDYYTSGQFDKDRTSLVDNIGKKLKASR